ncbi:MAG: hypothetical protein NC200_01635 [Candidatus Gastranaerophilales bacterium]|nr:hypothetical protein [Candidatus Gastranaerophilales bacterium]
MPITGNILIDKLRFNIPLAILEGNGINTESYKQEIRNTLEKYFINKNAYSVAIAYNYLRITLTPTRFKPDDNGVYTDTNLEMPLEEWLLNLFKKLGFNKNRRIDESTNITWIHLTKNIITNNTPLDYIMFLAGFPLRKRFISSLISSNGRNTSLRLSTPKRNTNWKDIIGDRGFIFYDKTQELLNKANKGIITLKSPLPNDEIKYISSHGGYKIENNSILNISRLNLLRCELQYRYKEKIKPLQKFLNPNSKRDSLTMATIIDLLQKKELYSKLDNYYTNELKEVVFYKSPDESQEQLTSYKKAFADLLDDSDITTLQLTYDVFGLKNLFSANVKNVIKSVSNELYNELYRKVILGQIK